MIKGNKDVKIMKEKQRTTSAGFVLAISLIVSLLISSCLLGELPIGAATPTSTPAPTLAPTLTPTQTSEEMISDALETACQGEPVSAAEIGTVSGGRPGGVRLCPEEYGLLSLALPEEWVAKTPGDLRYVIAVRQDGYLTNDSCGPYSLINIGTGGTFATQKLQFAEIDLIDVKTGEVVDHSSVEGPPMVCPQSIRMSGNETPVVIGEPAGPEAIQADVIDLLSQSKDTWTLNAHVAAVPEKLAFSPDGSLLASVVYDHVTDLASIKVWDVASHRILYTLDQTGRHIAFSPDGKLLAWTGPNGTVTLWDLTAGQKASTLDSQTNLVEDFTFSPDGKWLALAAYDQTVQLWDVVSGTRAHVLKNHKDAVLTVAFSADGKYLASGSRDNTIILWDMTSLSQARVLKGHKKTVVVVAFSPDGKHLASGSSDHTTKVWDLSSGRVMHTLEHNGLVEGIAFSPDGNWLVSTAWLETPKIWEVASGQPVSTLPTEAIMVDAVAFSPDGTVLAWSNDNIVTLWKFTLP